MYDIDKIVPVDTVDAAIAALLTDPGSIVICGGSDVLVKIREGKLAGASLVSIREIPELKGIRMDGEGTIIIGPSSTFSEITADPIIRKYIPTLGHAVDQAGGPQLRNIGTIGGNICNGVTSADSASTLLTLNAELEITGPGGKRQTRLEDFYAGPGKVHLSRGELLTAILIRRESYEGFSGHYIKYAMRNAMDIATLGCAVHVKMKDDTIEELRLAFGVASPVPMRCRKTEAAVKGKVLSDETLALVSDTALTEVSPRTSWRATKEFRLQLVRELSRRALVQAAENSKGAAL